MLGYSLRKQNLAAGAQAACLAECRRVARNVPTHAGAESLDSAALPVCRDADDQKFLELARACRADFLVTKDLLLLELDRRKARRAPFGIVTPAQLVATLIAP